MSIDATKDVWREEFLLRVAVEEPPLLESVMALSCYLQEGEVWDGTASLLRQLEEGVTARCRGIDAADHDAKAAQIMAVLAEHGFRGDAETFEDVSNSFLDRVLQSRKGLPITLGVLTLHLAEVADVDLVGIGFPGHFLVAAGLSTATPSIFDPFNDGLQLGFDDLGALFRAATGRTLFTSPEAVEELFRPLHKRDVIRRMLRNLQHHFAARGSHERVADVVELLVTMHPEFQNLRDAHLRKN